MNRVFHIVRNRFEFGSGFCAISSDRLLAEGNTIIGHQTAGLAAVLMFMSAMMTAGSNAEMDQQPGQIAVELNGRMSNATLGESENSHGGYSRSTGELPAAHMEMLRQVGDWLRINGASSYGTHRTKLGRQSFGWTTAKEKELFLHVLDWPGEKLVVEDIQEQVSAVGLLASGNKLPFQQNGSTLVITTPKHAPDTNNTVIAVRIIGRGKAPGLDDEYAGFFQSDGLGQHHRSGRHRGQDQGRQRQWAGADSVARQR